MTANEQNGENPKIIIDDDWKREAQAEKERLAEQEKKSADRTTGQGPLPQADFTTLVSSFLTQALVAMGMIEHPQLKRSVNLDLAKFNVDMLSVLEEKTRGNLTEQEKQMLDQALHQVRMAFVEVAAKQPGPIG